MQWKAAKEAGNYIIENSKDINEPHLSADKQNEMELFFEDIQFLTRFYGCHVFDLPEKPIEEEKSIDFTMRMSKSGLHAKLRFYRESKRYVIASGSTLIAETFKSCPKGLAEFRKQVMGNKKLAQQQGELYVLLQDIDLTDNVSSPSGAASFCAGTSYQGTEAWADKNQRKYPSEWWKE